MLGLLLAACGGARRLTLPTDPGGPLSDFAQVHGQVSMACSAVRTLTAEIGLSGRAGDQRLRGRIHAGFERPASMRLEAVGPLARRLFTLAARDGSATLLFETGDPRVVRNAPPEEILGALTGVTFAPADLQAILTGCVAPSPRPTAGRLHGNGWASIDLDGGAVVYLERQAGQWQVRAGRRNGWQFDYPQWQGRFPQAVRLQSPDAAVDLTTTIAQLETNVPLDAAAFRVDVPAGAQPLTLEELRQAGPLRGN